MKSRQSDVAIVHEWVTARAGSELTFERMAHVLPNADLYALSADPTVELETHGRMLRTSRLDKLARKPRGRAMCLIGMPLAMRALLPKGYEIVISSSHSFSRAAPGPGVVHLSYTYSPMRYAWYPDIDGRAGHRALAPARRALRSLDKRIAAGVDSFAAISTEVANRIAECYDRESQVIYPPCDTEFFTPGPSDRAIELPDTYMLSVGRMIPYKRHDLVIEVARRSGVPAVIAGSGPELTKLSQLAAATKGLVRVIESPSNELVRSLYREASVTVFPPFEDFGIVPVESMACGTPVVALGRGGSLDTVGSIGGRLCSTQEPEEFAEAVTRVISAPPSAEDCRRQADLFSVASFDQSFSNWIAEYRQ